jgi:hypothetical protein
MIFSGIIIFLFVLFISFTVGLLSAVLVYIAYIVSLSFMLWMIVDAAKNDKLAWLAIMVALPVVGSIVYFFVEKEHDYVHIPSISTKRKI